MDEQLKVDITKIKEHKVNLQGKMNDPGESAMMKVLTYHNNFKTMLKLLI